MPQPEAASSLPSLSERTTDTWVWQAFYDDGTCIEEYGADRDHAFAEIDLTRLRTFQLVNVADPTRGYAVLIDPSKGQRPIFFRRRASNWLIDGGQTFTMMTCIGRQETVHGTNVSTYVFFDDDGHVVIADRHIAD